MERSIYNELEESDHTINPNSSPSNDLPQFERREGGTIEYLTPQELAQWRWSNVDNLDAFLKDIYDYYIARGFLSIILSRFVQMATVLFIVVFTTYLYSCIDYHKITRAKSLDDIRIPKCIAKTSRIHKLGLWLFGLLFGLKTVQYISQLKLLWEIHEFYKHVLKISENELQTIPWDSVVSKIVSLRNTNLRSLKYKLDANSVVTRIMRQENYMIALYNQQFIDLQISYPFISSKKLPFFTKSIEWCINICILDYVFNQQGHLRPIFLKETKRDELSKGLKRRFLFAAILSCLFFPLTLLYTSIYYFFRYFNDYRSNPKNIGTRQYTPLAELKFREYNELYHLFKMRISSSYEPAEWYISLFPKFKTEIIMKFTIFICSSFAAVLGTLALYDPEFLQLELRPDQSVLFYLTGLGILITVCQAALNSPQDQASYDPETAMLRVIEYTHYYPNSWQGKLHKEFVKNEFLSLYDLKFKTVLREVLGVFLNPVILGVNLASKSDEIVDFFREYTIYNENYGGYFCKLADFSSVPPTNVPSTNVPVGTTQLMENDDKMMKSYLNFMNVYDSHANTDMLEPELEPSVPNSDSDSDSDVAKDGVIGLLNNLYHR